MTILRHFQGTPRPQQVQALLEVERSWSSHDVFVLRLPVGSGKSRVLKCITDWAGGGALVTPSNLLVNQYKNEFKDLEPPRARREFGPLAWAEYLAAYKRRKVGLCNYYSFLALRAYKPVVCFDEAHNLIQFLQEKEELKVWEGTEGFPPWLRTAMDLSLWAAQTGNLKLSAALEKDPLSFSLRFERLAFRGKPRNCVRVIPLTPKDNAPILWPRQVKKLVLASATLHEEDLLDLGLDKRRVLYVDTDSPIPVEQRPITFLRKASLSANSGEAELKEAVAALKELAAAHPTRGLVHVTYALARELRVFLGSEPRFMFHSPQDKASVFSQWQQSKDGILLGAGFSEGIDLAGDKARWQAILKVLFPNLGDPAVYAKAQLRPKWYAWQAASSLIQATGRVCRGPEDFGETFVLDRAFAGLYNKHQDLFPEWFKGALR